MITIRLTWTGGDAPQVDTITLPEGTHVQEGVTDFGSGVTCLIESL